MLAIGPATSIATAPAQTYTITELETLDGGTFTQGFEVDTNAQVIGRSALKATLALATSLDGEPSLHPMMKGTPVGIIARLAGHIAP